MFVLNGILVISLESINTRFVKLHTISVHDIFIFPV